jgi:hypothetical protein
VEQEFLEGVGSRKARVYKVGTKTLEGSQIVSRAIELGLEQMKQLGEIE